MKWQKVRYNFGDSSVILDRPVDDREIPLKWGSERGFIPSLKKRDYEVLEDKPPSDLHILDHESLLEHDFLPLSDLLAYLSISRV